ncbi:MAG: gfo/Idh/MocA family oxidoreductase, partial [Oscillospiraceae bacterium]
YPTTSRVEVEIVTDKGLMQIYDNDLFWQPTGKNRENLLKADSATGTKACWGLGHETLIGDFYAKRAANEKFPIDAKEGAKAINMIDAIYRSSSMKRIILM